MMCKINLSESARHMIRSLRRENMRRLWRSAALKGKDLKNQHVERENLKSARHTNEKMRIMLKLDY
jgi:hypothetical protein